jgi:hypothetical protein
MNLKYARKKNGIGGRIIWPPRSPDFTPFDFFCGQYTVYSAPPSTTFPGLSVNIRADGAAVTLSALTGMSTEHGYQFDVFRAAPSACYVTRGKVHCALHECNF